MSSRIASGSGTVGLVLQTSAQDAVTIASGTTIAISGSGPAVYAVAGVVGTLVNYGVLDSQLSGAVSFNSGGTVVNGSATDARAVIAGGAYGVDLGPRGPGLLTNFGTITAAEVAGSNGVVLEANGSVRNGTAADRSAIIRGYFEGVTTWGQYSTVTNYGMISGSGASLSIGVYLHSGGTCINGSTADTTATIVAAQCGIKAITAGADVVNYGTVLSTGPAAAMSYRGVLLGDGGTVVNGSAADTGALISAAGGGVYIKGMYASIVRNFGTITCADPAHNAIYVRDGGTITNGSAADSRAVIWGGAIGVGFGGALASTVYNYGTIYGQSRFGIEIYAGGTIVNGSTADTSALIGGAKALYLNGLNGSSVRNYGTIASRAGSGQDGVDMLGGGMFINGAKNDLAASVSGDAVGLLIDTGTATIINYGHITGQAGVSLQHGGRQQGVTLTAVGTIVNFGTIANSYGANGTAIRFGSGSERLVMEAGSAVIGQVKGGSGTNTLELGTGSGTLYNFARAFSGFGTITLDAGAAWTLTGTTALPQGEAVTGPGTLFSGGRPVPHTAAAIRPPASAPSTVRGTTTLDRPASASGVRAMVASGGTSVSGYTTIGVTLTLASAPDVFISTSGTIAASSTYVAAIYAARGVAATIVNMGQVGSATQSGTELNAGGSVTNGSAADTIASVSGYAYGVRFSRFAPGNVVNFGTIASHGKGFQTLGVALGDGGTVINGSPADTAALIAGYRSGLLSLGAPATVINYATVSGLGQGAGDYGVYFRSGGTVINGSASDTVASITGYYRGIVSTVGAATVVNYGTVTADAVMPGGGKTVALAQGGKVVNGGTASQRALLWGVGANTVMIKGISAATLSNYGTIINTAATGRAVSLRPGGVFVNGAGSDAAALVTSNGDAVGLTGWLRSNVSNFGTLHSTGGFGLDLGTGGSILNGSVSDVAATVYGPRGVYCGGAIPSTLTNYATIATGAAGGVGAAMSLGGEIVNGSSIDTKAVISAGVIGARIVSGYGLVVNYGTISGGTGISFDKPVSPLTTLVGIGTVVNAGTIESTQGAGGTAIRFGSGAERLVLDPGSVVVGKIFAGSAPTVLELAPGPGAGSSGGLGTTVQGFAEVIVDARATWTLAGDNTVAATTTLTSSGALSVQGTLRNDGSVAVAAGTLAASALSGAGSVTVYSGATLISEGAIGTAALVFAGGGNELVALGQAQGNSAHISGFGAGDVIDIRNVAVQSLSFAGGLLTLHDAQARTLGALDLSGTYSTANFRLSSDGAGGTDLTTLGLRASAVLRAAMLPAWSRTRHQHHGGASFAASTAPAFPFAFAATPSPWSLYHPASQGHF